MNQSEHIVHEWLQRQGYNDISFHHNTTPDFTTSSDSFEVKTLTGQGLVFSRRQWATLLQTPSTIIVVVDNCMIIAQFLFSDIQRCRFPVHIAKPYHYKLIGVSPETYAKLLEYKHPHQTMDGVILEIIHKAILYNAYMHQLEQYRISEEQLQAYLERNTIRQQ